MDNIQQGRWRAVENCGQDPAVDVESFGELWRAVDNIQHWRWRLSD